MTTMNISLPEPLQQFVEEQARISGYGTASEYVQSLIREAQLRAARQELAQPARRPCSCSRASTQAAVSAVSGGSGGGSPYRTRRA